MARFDWEILPEVLAKRMKNWKPLTLINKLERLTGKPLYKPKTKKKIKEGKFELTPARREELEKSYNYKIHRSTEEQRERMLPKASWSKIEDWLQRLRAKDETLNVEFSFARLIVRNLFWVYRRGKNLVFANKKPVGKLSFPENVPQYVVYSIYIEDSEGIETWVQVSAPQFYYGDPLKPETLEQGQDVVDEFQAENERAGAMRPNAYRYSWWAHNATESLYTFLGLGVTFL